LARLGEIAERLRSPPPGVERVCLQSVLKPGFAWELECMLRRLAGATSLPLSAAVTPLGSALLDRVARLVDALGVGVDAASPRVARLVGKPYPWRTYLWFVERAAERVGRGRVYAHLVAGLGETPAEMLAAIEAVVSRGARVALFRYTPVPGLPRLPGVDLPTYRFYQVARLLAERGLEPRRYADPSSARFTRPLPLTEEELLEAVMTSGCPGCNRPFYNEPPRGPLYNYPSPRLLARDRETVLRQLEEIGAAPAR
jgi:biotin synthase